MVNYTSRMLELLGHLRRETNGETSVSMRYYGKSYGLNYGVSLHSLRSIARGEVKDYQFAKYLFMQDIRELRLAALTIAEPEFVGVGEFESWSKGVVNSEIAEEMAQQLISKIDSQALSELFRLWSASDNALLIYCALLSVSRSDSVAAVADLNTIYDILLRHPDHQLIAKGVVNLLVALSNCDESKLKIKELLNSLPATLSLQYIIEEMEWRVES